MSKRDGRRGRDEGMARAAAAANPAWVAGVWECIKDIARQQPELSSDDIFRLADERKVEATHENRALGPLMKQAEKEGYIEATQKFIDSERTSKHLSPIRVWRSLVHDGQPLVSKKIRAMRAMFGIAS
jgi:hypothetical protein